MRSRYTAYVHGDENYLLQTWHSSTRPTQLSLHETQPDKWLGLKILKTELGGMSDTDGTVEFVARYKVNGRAIRLHEISQFQNVDGFWFYIKGELIE